MKILIVSQYFWPEDFRINDLTIGLCQAGHEVTVLTGQPNYPGGKIFPGYGWFKNTRQDYGGVMVRRVPLIPRGRGGALRLMLNYLSFAIFSTLLAPFYCRGKVDAIFVFEPSPITVGLPAILLRRIKRAPVLFWVLDLWPDSLSATGAVQSPLILRGVERLVCFIYRRCDLILVQSRGFIEHVQRHGGAAEKIRYFPSWAEALYQPLPPAPEQVPAMPGGFRIMFAGNVGVAQDFGTILDAAQRLHRRKDIHWLIVGDGRLLEWVRQQVEARGLSDTVHLFGRYPVAAMPAFFAMADVMLVSLKRAPIFELTIPGKIQSYLACARPLLVMLDGEGARIVKEAGAGLTCPAQDAVALERAVLTMAAMPKLEREAMGQAGRRYYEANFDRAMLFQRVEGWMRELAVVARD
ncbi:MAG: glycosyltransferase family 4 protein [Pseudomonadota bacterium]